ncbi:oligopeptide ABC transporter permease OppB [Marinivivus vitaminiproducens]|uniref:oligopeptide ABC transporter permease OppB n=1 Tax=Marinivivus vitaminiproducens TaxID=3035935 RepID=UPI0027A282E0|nr:oligopeptide ABC transporter permease OppB [Geminicoccaceae bacterium SCSIO 64248]
MLTYVARRLVGAIPTVFFIVTVAFFLIRIAPGGPFNLERPLPDQVMANLNAVYHLDEPLLTQYGLYLVNLLQGNFGPSFVYRDFSVGQLFANGLPMSIQLGGSALLLALLVGTAAGVLAAMRQNTTADHTIMAGAMVGLTIPNFVMAPVLSLIFAIWLGWLPAGGWGDGALINKALPVLTLALPQIAIIARLTRGSMLEALRSNHVRTARAYGLPAFNVVVVHALRGAMLPVISYLGPAAAALLTGSVVIETIFGIPGVGRYFVQGALNRDYTLVMGTVVLISVFVVLFNLIVDLLYAWVDPKVRFD